MTICLAPSLHLPVDAVTETFAIIAKRRVGKSNVAVVMAEQMYDAGIPWVAIDPKGDWWGIRSSADGTGDGLAVTVFGGRHGDLPLPADSGAYMADLIAERRLTCVLDVSEFTKGEQIRFLKAFAERLLKVNTEPLHLFFEECDDYIPQAVQSDETMLVRAFSRLVRHGGFKGIGCTLITQRAALVSKNVLAQVETLIVLRTTHPPDQKQVGDWMGKHDLAKEVLGSLSSLPVGEGWVLSPGFLGQIETVAFDRRRTFDSGATPKMGEKRVEPTRLADVDLAAIREQMADAIERTKNLDPVELQKRIRELEKQLAAKPTAAPAPAPEIEYVDRPVLDPAVVAEFREQLGALEFRFDAFLERLSSLPAPGSTPPPVPMPVVAPGRADHGSTPGLHEGSGRDNPPPSRPARAPAADDGVHLKAGAQRLLDTVARHHPVALTRSQIATLAKIKKTGGTFGTYWSILKRAGYIEEASDGDLVRITDAGLARASVEAAQPLTTEDLLAMWRDRLKAGARAMLDCLVELYPASIEKDELGAKVGIEPTGGTFGTYLSILRRNGLADVHGSTITASKTLFLADR